MPRRLRLWSKQGTVPNFSSAVKKKSHVLQPSERQDHCAILSELDKSLIYSNQSCYSM